MSVCQKQPAVCSNSNLNYFFVNGRMNRVTMLFQALDVSFDSIVYIVNGLNALRINLKCVNTTRHLPLVAGLSPVITFRSVGTICVRHAFFVFLLGYGNYLAVFK